MLADKGFAEVFNMEGGIRAWEGFVAEGLPDAGMAYFPKGASPLELITLAWTLEAGSGKFYSNVAGMLQGKTKDLFAELVKAEEHHKESLNRLYAQFAGTDADQGFPGSMAAEEKAGDLMEGGMLVSEALEWIRGKDPAQIVELAMALETNSYDLYLKMGRTVSGEDAQEIFRSLAAEEKKHLERLAAELEKMI